MEQVIDERVAHGLEELLDERALATDASAARPTSRSSVRRWTRHAPGACSPTTSSARSGRPSRRLGGTMSRREQRPLRDHQRPGAAAPVAPAADRHPLRARHVRHRHVARRRSARAELLAPGHPLHDAVIEQTIEQLGGELERGTVLVSADVEEPQLLVGVVEEIADATERVGRAPLRLRLRRRARQGRTRRPGALPRLRRRAADAGGGAGARLPWLADAEDTAMSWIIANQLPGYLDEVRPRRAAELKRVREQVELAPRA